MKMKSVLLSMLAVAALASCSKETDPAAESKPEAEQKKAYMAILITQPDAPIVRSEISTSDAVKSLSIVGFDATGFKLSVGQSGVYTVPESDIKSGKATVEINTKVKKIFVVANASAEMKSKLSIVTHFSELQTSTITTPLVWNTTGENLFQMTSEGLLDVKFASTPDAAQQVTVTVPLLRTVSKATYSDANLSVLNGTASLDGFLMNTTNKSYYPYAALVAYTYPDGGVGKGLYRKDPNWTKLTMTRNPDNTITGDAVTAFNWINNKTAAGWQTKGANEYFYENTMEAAAQDYNNTTKMIFKGRYTPNGVTSGDSWFRYNGTVTTFDELLKVYDAATTLGDIKIVAAFDSFAEKVMGAATKFNTLTLSGIDAKANGGYLAATADPCMIQYFQKSLCFYDVNIKHDGTVKLASLGRWGVVRNNNYVVNVAKISNPGLPFIPDPTDPDITDPSNPNPTDPTPNDNTNQNISVEITVNPWTGWSQEEEL